MAFAFERLAALTRRRGRRSGELPRLRRADAHPDNPVRRPILARSELEPDLFTGPLRQALAEADAELGATSSEVAAPSSLEGLSLLELARRLETALTRKLESEGQDVTEECDAAPSDEGDGLAPMTLAEMTPAQRVPVKAAVDPALDRALREALNQLRGA